MASDRRYYLTEGDRRALDSMLRWWAQHGHQTGESRPRKPLSSPILFHLGKADETIAAGGAGDVRVWVGKSTTLGTTDYVEEAGSTTRETCRDWWGLGASTGDPVAVFRHQQSGELYFLSPGHRYDRIKGLLTAALASSSTTFTIDNVAVIRGQNPTTSSTVEVTIINTHNWSGNDNGLCRAEWCSSSSGFEAYQLTCATTT